MTMRHDAFLKACISCTLISVSACRHSSTTTTPPSKPAKLHLTHIDASLKLHPDEARVGLDASVELRGAMSPGGGKLELDAIDFRDVQITATPPLLTSHIDAERITLEWGATTQKDYVVTMTYSASPEKGITHTEQDIWTSFHTWHWLPVENSPGQRATLTLEVNMDQKGWHTTTTAFARETPHPAYTYGFHATRRAPLDSSTRTHGAHELIVSGTPHHALAMARTEGALTRWKSTFGDDWAPARYTQLFVPGRAMQEAAGLSFLSASHAAGLVKDPREDWLIVHELAHQEWGNLVTCATWGDFWINEAFAVWWVYRDRILRGEEESARRELDLWRARTQRALDRGDDARVHRPGATHHDAGGSIVYHAGALILHDLSTLLGEAVFERTLRALVTRARAQKGLVLTTAEFLDAFELDASSRQRIEAMLADARLVLN